MSYVPTAGPGWAPGEAAEREDDREREDQSVNHLVPLCDEK